MTNPKHLKIFEQGLDVWNEWREENKDIIPNLRKINLSHISLFYADFHNTDLSGSDFSYVNLGAANLSGAKVSGSNFSFANLSVINLSNADLSHTDLSATNLNQANLSGANLIGSDLSDAKLGYADLSFSNLSEVKLKSSNLNVANLRYAKLNGVVFNETNFGNTDLTHVQNLESCKHNGPSYLDRQTIINSSELPIEFLRGCGISDWEIEVSKLYNPRLKNHQITDIIRKIDHIRNDIDAIQFNPCFISYNHKDKLFAKRLHDELQEKGIRCWMDEHPSLDDYFEQQNRSMRLWDKVLLCCSKDSLENSWVNNEIDNAFEKEHKLMKEYGKQILALIPLNLDDYLSYSWNNEKKNKLCSRLSANFVGWENDEDKFNQEFDKVIRALQANDGGREKPSKSLL